MSAMDQVATLKASICNQLVDSKPRERINVVSRERVRRLRVRKDPTTTPFINPGDPAPTTALVIRGTEVAQVRSTLCEECRTPETCGPSQRDMMRQERMERYGQETRLREHEKIASFMNAGTVKPGERMKQKQQLEEDNDDIRGLSQYITLAKCAAIRDQQIQEKEWLKGAAKAEEDRLNALMENDRIEKIAMEEEKEKTRDELVKHGFEVIRSQIREREEAKLLQQELQDRETQEILDALARQKVLDQEAAVAQQKSQRELMVRIARANTAAIEAKKKARQDAIEEDQKILKYLLEKEQKDLEREKGLEEKRVAREKELAKLRAAQQKATDKVAEQQALRAQRAQIAIELAMRSKEEQAKALAKEQEEALRVERRKQQEAKDLAVAAEAHKMKREMLENLAKQRQMDLAAKQEILEAKKKAEEHLSCLQVQIKEKEAARLKTMEGEIDEGVRSVEACNVERARIEGIMEQKIQELAALGVPGKYCREVERQSKKLGGDEVRRQIHARVTDMRKH